MRILVLAEVVLVVLILLVFFTQVFMPLWRGTRIFPIFRKERKLEARLTKTRQERVEADIERDIAEEQRRLGKRPKAGPEQTS